MSLRDGFFAKGRVEDCPIYDLHGHMGPFHGASLPMAETDTMIGAMDRAGVKLLVFSHHAAIFSPDVGNQASTAAVRRHPGRLRAYCTLNGNYPELCRQEVESFEQHGDVYLGFKLHADCHGVPVTADVYIPAWELADRQRLMVLMHTWGGSPLDGPEPVRKIAERYPNVQLICGHSFHGDWDAAARIARDHPNLYLELTAVPDDRGVLEGFMEAGCPSEKIVFGTDYPWFDFHYYIGAVLGAGLSDEECRNVFYRNAERIIGRVRL